MERINRIIEVDVDTDRKPNIRLRIVKNHPIRGEVPCETNLKQDVYVVQLRLLENNHSRFDTDPNNLTNIVGVGQTFSKGNEVVKIEDILIVDADADSEALLGKKALIVKENVEFSHILALSKSLRIPSVFNIETLVLDGVKEVRFIAEGITAYITKEK
jgi:hypothetical protein